LGASVVLQILCKFVPPAVELRANQEFMGPPWAHWLSDDRSAAYCTCLGNAWQARVWLWRQLCSPAVALRAMGDSATVAPTLLGKPEFGFDGEW